MKNMSLFLFVLACIVLTGFTPLNNAEARDDQGINISDFPWKFSGSLYRKWRWYRPVRKTGKHSMIYCRRTGCARWKWKSSSKSKKQCQGWNYRFSKNKCFKKRYCTSLKRKINKSKCAYIVFNKDNKTIKKSQRGTWSQVLQYARSGKTRTVPGSAESHYTLMTPTRRSGGILARRVRRGGSRARAGIQGTLARSCKLNQFASLHQLYGLVCDGTKVPFFKFTPVNGKNGNVDRVKISMANMVHGDCFTLSMGLKINKNNDAALYVQYVDPKTNRVIPYSAVYSCLRKKGLISERGESVNACEGIAQHVNAFEATVKVKNFNVTQSSEVAFASGDQRVSAVAGKSDVDLPSRLTCLLAEKIDRKGSLLFDNLDALKAKAVKMCKAGDYEKFFDFYERLGNFESLQRAIMEPLRHQFKSWSKKKYRRLAELARTITRKGASQSAIRSAAKEVDQIIASLQSYAQGPLEDELKYFMRKYKKAKTEKERKYYANLINEVNEDLGHYYRNRSTYKYGPMRSAMLKAGMFDEARRLARFVSHSLVYSQVYPGRRKRRQKQFTLSEAPRLVSRFMDEAAKQADNAEVMNAVADGELKLTPQILRDAKMLQMQRDMAYNSILSRVYQSAQACRPNMWINGMTAVDPAGCAWYKQYGPYELRRAQALRAQYNQRIQGLGQEHMMFAKLEHQAYLKNRKRQGRGGLQYANMAGMISRAFGNYGNAGFRRSYNAGNSYYSNYRFGNRTNGYQFGNWQRNQGQMYAYARFGGNANFGNYGSRYPATAYRYQIQQQQSNSPYVRRAGFQFNPQTYRRSPYMYNRNQIFL